MTSKGIPFSERSTPLRGVLDLVTGCYPPFLFGGNLQGWLPVFHFHEVTADYLEPYLKYLADNGYRTVISDAIAACVRQSVHPGSRAVALCFDDAWASVWTVAAPLLRRYGLQAITYVSPARVSELAKLRPTIDSPGGAPRDIDCSDHPFASWAELKTLHDAGTVEIQAHSTRHAMIFSDSTVRGFVQPGLDRHLHLYPLLDSGHGERYLTPGDLGAPLYTQRSRYSTGLRYDNPQAFEACTRHVAANGGEAYFARPGWRKELGALAARFPGRQETEEQRDAAVLEELGVSREILNARLGTNTVRHMCFPWAIANRPAEVAAERAGFVTAFGDRLFGTRAVRAGDPPYRMMRLRHELLYCLPGRGRRYLWQGIH